mmetsp:Transcript_24390/g.67561  ORF Transcript_24390/g.67561 Transcript_24390/m.67561 type:complete len:982 (+) Transcript_24390:268-3213(+)|eukprot:CAMPEP_0168724176 /NCGR_PEP_ID=MMETSP0724-20121128/3499_1 /TAXON_ID=265536 /ORGANISM="Amphiprora sp., Strain CCMP467" /LENGTH=981 /DNA_ID=CAMNT_0008770913 /DNA_START=181 /DNA_END=3126 /DNA_ORIENTATION=+
MGVELQTLNRSPPRDTASAEPAQESSNDEQTDLVDSEEVDPMVVVPKRMASTQSGLSSSMRQLQTRNGRKSYWVWLTTATVIVFILILWNHFVNVMLPSDGKTTVSKNNKGASVSRETQHPSDASGSASEKLPSSMSTSIPYFHAAQALECRESVVNFVINATDARDECEGLKKAFDKTCGSHEDLPSPNAASSQRESSTQARGNSQKKSPQKKHRFGQRRANKANQNRRVPAKNDKKNQLKQNQKHRRLSEKTRLLPDWRRWKLWLYETKRTTMDLWRYWFGARKDFLFAEDEILQAWEDAESLVVNDLDSVVNAELTRQWELERRRRHLQEVRTDNTTIYTNETLVHQSNKTKQPLANLDLPTLRKHATGAVIQDVLMLKQGDRLINQTSAAAQEAAESSKAMSDTAAAVSAVLNDPTSVEARTCCTSILNVYHENCSTDDEEDISDTRLFLIVFVMALCGMVKSLIRHYQILWLPEAAGCILVGVFSGYVLMFFPHHDLSFDGHWFLRIMVPPIIFEAALSIDKRSFNRHVVPILLYAIAGTLLATFITAEVVHRGSHWLEGWCSPIPYIESLTFGALISSIDPIAVLSVLSNMGMTDKDTIYVLIFGESLLNDGVSIVLFETLVHFLDEHLIIDQQAVVEASIHFTVVAVGSVLVGASAGLLGTVYFWLFQGCQTPLVEVLMFFCWALLPYYICDGIGWSGIVSAVATGFVMDIFIVGQRRDHLESGDSQHARTTPPRVPSLLALGRENIVTAVAGVFSGQEGHLSEVARMHIGFVTGMIATTMETAIFAYLGLFLFSHRYHWSLVHALIAIFACCFSRGVMIPCLSFFVNMSTKATRTAETLCPGLRSNNTQTGVVIDHKMQFVLWFAGLRGAMSFALVESIPLYDSVSGEGTMLKPELKAITSACIMFTVFVLGGYTYYVMDNLGLAPSNTKVEPDSKEALVADQDEGLYDPLNASSHASAADGSKNRRRQRPNT